MSTASIPALNTIDEACKKLGVSPKTIRNRIASGELGCHRVGSLIRISDQQISEYLEGVRQDPRLRESSAPTVRKSDWRKRWKAAL